MPLETYAQDIVDTVREPLLMLDTSLRVHSANRAFYQTFQVSAEETEHHLIYELGNGQWNIPALRTLLDDVVPWHCVFNDFELEHMFPVIGRRVMLLNARQLKAGNHGELLVLAMEDVTERRRAEHEMVLAKEMAEAANRTKSLFLASMSHDLRTPLTSLITGMRTLEGGGDLDAFQREMVEISISGGETLLGMINDLLDVEKMESGSLSLEYIELDAAALVTCAAGQVASLCKAASLSLVIQIPAGLPLFQGDEDKLRRVLVNLLGNAIKFTPRDGNITVEVGLGENGAELVFSVSDTGEGIPPEAFERIFERFGQVESRLGGRTMSTGLGLAFCKLTVEAHGGRLGVNSVPGEGSTFSFTIPSAPRRGCDGSTNG